MWGKIFIILTNMSSIVTLYYGLKNKEYTIMYSIITTSIISLVFHLMTEYSIVSVDTLEFFRLLDFYYSYKSIYIVTTNVLTDYTTSNFNYDIIINPVLLIMAKYLTNKKYFLISIIPLSIGIIFPVLFFNRNNIIKLNFKNIRFWISLSLILTNIIFYVYERNFDYYVFHSVHHLLCFSYPGILIELKTFSKNINQEQKVIPKKSSLTNLSGLVNITEKMTETVQDTVSSITMKNSSYTHLEHIDEMV